ncbi:Glutathione S-transferase [Thelohanellus kitauei]|uniref:Glutathione S-transferase n=1 Tax=Thelohanellus kitauei TaxID=669202 RepID=A0A0C2I7E8_THEKT|nr:Glutathione S-transferase [Thelohanellus kitauei]
MTTQYTLHYFDMRARGEIIRLIFNFAGVPYTDNKVPFECWDDFKSNHELPFNQLPVLEFEGRTLAQSLNGNDNVEKAYLDQIVGGVEDLYIRLLPIIYLERDEKSKKEKLDKFFIEVYPSWLMAFQKLLGKYENGQKFLLGSKFSWADLALFEIIDLCLDIRSTSLLGFPALEGYHHRVSMRPELAKYLETRKPKEV